MEQPCSLWLLLVTGSEDGAKVGICHSELLLSQVIEGKKNIEEAYFGVLNTSLAERCVHLPFRRENPLQ